MTRGGGPAGGAARGGAMRANNGDTRMVTISGNQGIELPPTGTGYHDAPPVPPTALPADVYLENLERLLRENARLRAVLGQTLMLARTVSGLCGTQIESEWVEEAVDPLTKELAALLATA